MFKFRFLPAVIIFALFPVILAAQNEVDADTVSVADQQMMLLNEIRTDINLMRNEIAGLGDEEISMQLDVIEDRLAALDERMISLDRRVGMVYSEVGGFGSNFTIAIAIMICIAFITIVLVWIQRKKYIDPVNIQLARFEAELQKIDTDKANRIQKAMKELGSDDPLVAQLLKKYKLD